MKHDNIKEKYKELLDKVFELEGLLHLALSRTEIPEEVMNLIERKLEDLVPCTPNEDEELQSYAISDDDEEMAYEAEFEEEADAGDSSDEYTPEYSDADETSGVEVEFEKDTQTVSAGIFSFATDPGIDRQLRKKFSLNDMFRFASIFGNNRKKLTEALDAMNDMTDDEIVEYIGKEVPDCEDEIKEEFLMRILGEKE